MTTTKGGGEEPQFKKPKLHQEEEEEAGEDIDLLDTEDEEEEDDDQESTLPPAAQDAITLTLRSTSSSTPLSLSFPPEFTHQFFEEEAVPVGYPDLQIDLSFDGVTAAWTLTITYDEAKGRVEKEEWEMEEAERKTKAAAEGGGGLEQEEEEEEEEKKEKKEKEEKEEAKEISSSNEGDDVPLLRCLLPALTPQEATACAINGKKGWLHPDKGFLSEEEAKTNDGMTLLSSPPLVSLPFGQELARYTYTPRAAAARRKQTQEQQAQQQAPDSPPSEIAIFHALPSALHADNQQDHQHQQDQQKEKSDAKYHQGVANFHRRVQKWAPWFIENGDDVDPEAGEWELLYLVHRTQAHTHTHTQEGAEAGGAKENHTHTHTHTATATDTNNQEEGHWSFAGYLTLYAFTNPFKGKSLRICQVLILPPYQRQGHGQKLLRAAYTLARERDIVYEVTVEDPAPGFTMLRCVTDVQDLREAHTRTHTEGEVQADTHTHTHTPTESLLGPLLEDGSRFETLTGGEIEKVQRGLKITKQQVILAYECLKLLQSLPTPPSLSQQQQQQQHTHTQAQPSAASTTATFSSSSSTQQQQQPQPPTADNTHTHIHTQTQQTQKETAFRLMVKRRLAREATKAGEYVNQKEALQAYLDKAFRERVSELREVLERTGLLGVGVGVGVGGNGGGGEGGVSQ
jgi:GNAT superfamily N-acetyltransferase